MNEAKHEPTNTWVSRTFDDIDFHVRMRPTTVSNGRTYVVAYEAYEIVGKDSDDKTLFQRKGATASPDTVLRVEGAETFAEGTIKWDGCSHNALPADHHACSRGQMVSIGKLFDYLFDMALEMMPGNEEYLR